MPRLSKIGAAALAAFGWTSGSSVTADFLVVAGGGGGGDGYGGGGGAGGYLTGTTSLNPTQSYTVTVGAGGAGSTSSLLRGTQGSNSVFNAVTSTGGGGGGSANDGAGENTGGTGGSGGGGAANATGGTVTTAGGAGNTPSTSPSQGNNGGSGVTDSATYRAAGGGGGSGAVGSNGTSGAAGSGGNGTASSISGASVTYAGGGGGGGFATTQGAGGSGGGGAGGLSTSTAAVAGTANLGGGGGGGGDGTTFNGASGGSGVVIISYVGAQQFGGGVVTSSGGSTIHTFTTSGTLSPLNSLTASYLIVAGGGGGGFDGYPNRGAGGGGAGGLLSGSGITIDTNSIYAITVGAGGVGASVAASPVGTNGTNSTFSMVTTTAIGGGGGGGHSASAQIAANSGGSGGGATNGFAGAAGTSGQGFAGGAGQTDVGPYFLGGGGGGSSAVGNTTSNAVTVGGAGGAGTEYPVGSGIYYAGGGGGGGNNSATAAAGGSGGGGASGVGGGAGVSGSANTGGGGGGARGAAGSGGSGVVIISYPGSTQQMAGGTVTVAGGNVIHTFTSSGYLTPIVLVNNSLRFRSSASAYLSRTFPTAGNRRTYTLSLWVKRGILDGSTNQFFFGSGVSTTAGGFYFLPTNQLEINPRVNNTNTYITTTQVFRDPSAWYHIVVALDTTQATDSNRLKLYVNGVQVTAFSAAIYPALNGDSTLNNNIAHWIGRYPEPGFPSPFDGYIAEYNFIDGQALTPSSFGTTSDLGVWQPIRYGGSYGTNGFYLKFTDTTSTTTLSYDYSPNGNNWTPNNISLTSGSTYDSMTDVPTLTSATTANYAVMNPVYKSASQPTISNGNLTVVSNAGTYQNSFSTIETATTGKYYCEVLFTGNVNSALYCGMSNSAERNYLTTTANLIASTTGGFSIDLQNGDKWTNLTSSAYGTGYANNDIIQIAYDADNGKLWFGKNGTWQASGNPAAGTNAAFTGITGNYCFGVTAYQHPTLGTSTYNANFGQRPFSYTPPTGFVSLNTFNLPTPTIGATASSQANKYFDATTYTGTGATQSITNSGSMQPDFIWFKSRALTYSHVLFDSVRGVTKGLDSATTAAELTSSAGNDLSTFTSTGFTVGPIQNWNSPNNSSSSPVAWQWRASNTTPVSNTAGSITSTVSASTTAGFSIVTYTGNGSSGTVGHGLGVAPSMIIVKSRSTAQRWTVFHTSTSNAYIYLNETFAADTTNANLRFGDNTVVVQPTSTVFSIGNSVDVNQNTTTYVAYCFAQVAGYSAFGSYTGNGSSDGPFVFTGFRPRFILIRRTDAAGGWKIYNTSGLNYNPIDTTLETQDSAAEATSASFNMDWLSNGFKLRTTYGDFNTSSSTYIYMAFAESPFKFSLGR